MAYSLDYCQASETMHSARRSSLAPAQIFNMLTKRDQLKVAYLKRNLLALALVIASVSLPSNPSPSATSSTSLLNEPSSLPLRCDSGDVPAAGADLVPPLIVPASLFRNCVFTNSALMPCHSLPAPLPQPPYSMRPSRN